MTEIWNLNALCRCCHADGSYRELNSTCNIMGSLELCTNLLKDTYGIYLQSQPIEVSNSICDDCILQLQNATIFKRQVLSCEQKFQEYCKNESLQYIGIKLENENDYDVIAKSDIALKYEENGNGSQVIQETSDIEIKYEPQDAGESIEATSDPIDEDEKKDSDIRKPNRTKDNTDMCICEICKITIKSQKSLNKHMSDMHSPYRCNVCNINIKNDKAYNTHMENHSICVDPTIPLSEITKFDCKTCSKSYRSMYDLRRHRNTHTRDLLYICDLCKSEFLYKGILRKHLLWHMGLNKKCMCDTCGNSFNDLTNLNRHIMTVHKKLKPFKCTVCSKAFATNKSLKNHTPIHTGERPYKCNACDKTYVTYSNLAKHKANHERKKIYKMGGIYVCKICKVVFDHRGIYTTHLRTHATAIKHICPHCNQNFLYEYSLKRHLEKHISNKKYSCDTCDKTYATKFQLYRHERLHSTKLKKAKNEKVKCEVCKKLYTDIDKHMKAHNNRRHQCDFCDRAYAERNTLTRHVKQCHDGVRFECDVCDKGFVKSYSLKKHKMKTHDITQTKTEG